METMRKDNGVAATITRQFVSLEACRRTIDGVAAPLSDLSLLPRLHTAFERECRVPDPVGRRRMFIFVIVALYAPGSLAGRRLPQGMRQALSSVLHGVSPCRLSSQLPEAVWEYGHYRDFHDEATRLLPLLWAEAAARDTPEPG